MSRFDNFLAAISPHLACERMQWRAAYDEMRRGYDAGKLGRGNTHWRASNQSAEQEDRYDRDRIRARARDLERNSDILNADLLAFRRNVVGRGFTLRPQTGDEALNDRLSALWKRWCRARNCDVTGQQSLTELLRMMVTRKKVDGGVLLYKCYVSGRLLPLTVQLLEVDELDDMSQSPKRAGNRVIGGVEYDKYARPVYYHIRQYDLDGLRRLDPVILPAKDVLFYYTKRRPSQIREMNPGEDIESIDPKGGSDDAAGMLKTLQRQIGAALGLSYEAASRDMSQTNYSSARQGLIEDNETYAEEIDHIVDILDELYESFVISAVLAGAVEIPDFWHDKGKYLAHRWARTPKAWIDPLKEASANKTAVQSGQKTFQQIAAENGRDWKEQIDEMAEVEQYAREKGIQIGGVIYGTEIQNSAE